VAKDKSLAIDGFRYEFYKTFWDMVGPDLLYLYKEAILLGSLGAIINKGNVKFIPKDGDLEVITN